MARRMNIYGVGPLMYVGAILAAVVLYTLDRYLLGWPRIDGTLGASASLAGTAFLLLGIPAYVWGLIAMVRAVRRETLVTTGAFGRCRNPIYAAVIILIVPGLVLLLRRALPLLTPAATYLIFRMLIPIEERRLGELFGQTYVEYKNRIPRLFPRWRVRAESSANSTAGSRHV